MTSSRAEPRGVGWSSSSGPSPAPAPRSEFTVYGKADADADVELTLTAAAHGEAVDLGKTPEAFSLGRSISCGGVGAARVRLDWFRPDSRSVPSDHFLYSSEAAAVPASGLDLRPRRDAPSVAVVAVPLHLYALARPIDAINRLIYILSRPAEPVTAHDNGLLRTFARVKGRVACLMPDQLADYWY